MERNAGQRMEGDKNMKWIEVWKNRGEGAVLVLGRGRKEGVRK
jgi:hypothetical protein